MAAWVELREISNEEGQSTVGIVRRTSGSVVTWRRAQVVLLSAQGMRAPKISEVVSTDPATVRRRETAVMRSEVEKILGVDEMQSVATTCTACFEASTPIQ